MGKHIPAQRRAEAVGGLCGKVLRRQRTDKPQNAEQHQHNTHFCDIYLVVILDSHIDHGRHNQRHNQFKARLQKLKQRAEQAFFFVIPKIRQKFFDHKHAPFSNNFHIFLL